jgi:hypothetical protein
MKRSSTVLEKAEKRASAIFSIQEDLDLGSGLKLDDYYTLIASVREKQKRYNASLSTIDQLYSDLMTEEKELMEMSEHMLSGVKVKFGRDSDEYEMAGGVRRSKRKRPERKAKVEMVQP